MGGPPPGGPPGGLGGNNAFNPKMWAGSGVPNPHNIGKPPGQGGFNVQSLLPPNLLPGAGQAGGQGPAPPHPAPQGGIGGLIGSAMGRVRNSPFGPLFGGAAK